MNAKDRYKVIVASYVEEFTEELNQAAAVGYRVIHYQHGLFRHPKYDDELIHTFSAIIELASDEADEAGR